MTPERLAEIEAAYTPHDPLPIRSQSVLNILALCAALRQAWEGIAEYEAATTKGEQALMRRAEEAERERDELAAQVGEMREALRTYLPIVRLGLNKPIPIPWGEARADVHPEVPEEESMTLERLAEIEESNRLLRVEWQRNHPLAEEQPPTSSEALCAALHEAWGENDRLRQDRADALNVKTREGLTCSEWIARTGAAERERDELAALVEKMSEALSEIADEKRPRDWCTKCSAWVETAYGSGSTWCKKCKQDVGDFAPQERYEAVAQAALAAAAPAALDRLRARIEWVVAQAPAEGK